MGLMDLKQAREFYEYNSGKASDVARQLSLAGIAIVWLFSGGGVSTGIDNVNIKGDLLRAGLTLVIALALDLLQYVYASAAWGVFHRVKERSLGDEARTFDAPRQINWPTLTFFWLKLLAVAVAYSYLILTLWRRLL